MALGSGKIQAENSQVPNNYFSCYFWRTEFPGNQERLMPDAGGNITKQSLYEFIERETKLDESIGEAQYTVRALKKDKKNLRALIVAAGFDLSMFDRTRQMMAIPYEQREAEFKELLRNMAWMGMPIGTQTEMFSQEETAVPPEIQISRVRDAGRTAGKLGRERSANPWPAGQLLYQEWDSSWLAGKEEAAQSATPAAPKRGPGRPKKTEAAAPAKPAAGLRKGKNEESHTAAPPAAPQEAPPSPSGLEFDTETEGTA
jgi:hypothetical protein